MQLQSNSHKVELYYIGDSLFLAEVVVYLEKVSFEQVNLLYIMPLKDLLTRFTDEMVYFRLVEDQNLAMNRGLEEHEEDPLTPLEILVALDHPALEKYLMNLQREGWSSEEVASARLKQIVLSVLHEEAHLQGVETEEEAEKFAEKRFDSISEELREV
jgi:hypothetical protein